MTASQRHLTALAAVLALALAGCEGGSGPAGPAGPTGAQGAAGVAGAPGDKGDKGDQGTKGEKGDPGTNGQDGKNGQNGQDGKNGQNGQDGKNGQDGAKGDKGDKGDPGQTVVGQGTIAGTVQGGTPAAPIANAQVTTTPLGKTATTDAKGAFTLADLPIGAYALTVAAPGWGTKAVPAVGVVTGATTSVAVTLDAAGAPGATPTIVASGKTWVGYGKPVALAAAATDADTPATKLTWKWTQIGGPVVALTGATSANLSFTTKALSDHKKVSVPRIGVVGLDGDEAGRYVFELAVGDGEGHTAKIQLVVTCTEPVPGLRTLALGVPAYLQGEPTTDATGKVLPYNWTLDLSGANGSKAALEDPTSANPRFVADVKGTYKVTEATSKKSIVLYGGTWVGVVGNDGACTGCHSGFAYDAFTPIAATAHAKATQAKMNGAVGAFGPECMRCHAVGVSQAVNGGFDDVQKDKGWTFAAAAPGTWEALQKDQPALGQLAGIQCESCHGPQSSPAHGNAPKLDVPSRVSWSSSVCTTCHQQGPTYAKGAQWASTAHANLAVAIDEATFEKRGTTAAHCGRCHSAQGHALYVKQLKAGNAGVLVQSDGKAADEAFLRGLGLEVASVQPPTCAACHSPHEATHPSQLRLYDSIKLLPNGLAGISGVGAGAQCMACHNTRNGEHTDTVTPATANFSAPHAPAQTDVLYGFNAYFVPRFTPGGHLAVTDTCATCHVTLTAGVSDELVPSNHSFKPAPGLCAKCHAEPVNGKGLQAAFAMQHKALGEAIGAKALAVYKAAFSGNAKVTIAAWNTDPLYDVYSSPVEIAASNAVSSVELTEVHGQLSFILHFAQPILFSWIDAAGKPVTGAGGNALPPSSLKDVHVRAGDLKVQSGSAAATTVVDPKSDLNKAMWNWTLLHGDGSEGIHNPSFFKAVLSATAAKVAAL